MLYDCVLYSSLSYYPIRRWNMGTNYERFKGEISNIAETIQLFPEALHEKVFDVLIAELINNRSSQSTYSEPLGNNDDNIVVDTPVNIAETDFVPLSKLSGEAMFEFFMKNNENIQNMSDVAFATVVAYFYEVLAPAIERRAEINGKILIAAFETANRKPPNKPSNALNNAKKRNYLKPGSDRGLFTLTPNGRHYIRNKLLAEADNNE